MCRNEKKMDNLRYEERREDRPNRKAGKVREDIKGTTIGYWDRIGDCTKGPYTIGIWMKNVTYAAF